MHKDFMLPADRYFAGDTRQKDMAIQLYQSIVHLPLICPHGHVDAALFARLDFKFSNPAELLIIPDHYIFRMLYSQGISLEALGIPRQDGHMVESDPRRIWQIFAENFYLFQGTPTMMWLTNELYGVFNVRTKLTGESAQVIYDQIDSQLKSDSFTPRALYQKFNIEVLCTTDAAADTLAQHQMINESGWTGRILPTFRPDAVVNIDAPDWQKQIDLLSDASGITVTDYASYSKALEIRREFFKKMGAVSTDHGVKYAYTEPLSAVEAQAIFQRALQKKSTPEDVYRFTGHMLCEMARMSIEDGLVMQLHVGAYRGHNPWIEQHFGKDMGADIPIQVEMTNNLNPLLARYGNDPRLTLILFTLDETVYARELAPLAGHYPAVKLGPPWWFHDSWNGINRYFDQVMETAGIYNTVGFNDDTRAFPSIPARHDLWRRACANWLAGLVIRHMIDMADAEHMMHALAYDLAKRAYNLE